MYRPIERRLFKKYWKRKRRARFCLALGEMNFSEKKYLNIIFFVEKINFCPTLTIIFPIFGESEKGESNIIKKVSLGVFKELK